MMMNIITSEFYKIFRSKIFYGIVIILAAINLYGLIYSIKEGISSTGIAIYQESFKEDLWFYIVIVFTVCLITAEYTNGSIHQMASYGIARWKLVSGQYISMSSVITFVLIIFAVINLLIETVMGMLGDFSITAFINMNFGLICMIWGIAGIGTFLSYLFKNEAVTLGISFLIIMSKKLIASLLTLLTQNDIFTTYSFSNMRDIIIDLNSNPYEVIKCSIIFALIAMISLVLASLLFSKRDID